MKSDTSRSFILHAEDEECDVRMMQVILDRINFQGEYKNLSTGLEVSDWMQDLSKPRPDMLILDIGLPSIDGKELLAQIRKEESSLSLPVLMMSGSSSKRDFKDCVSMGSNAYIQKTPDIDGLALAMESFIDMWTYINKQTFF